MVPRKWWNVPGGRNHDLRPTLFRGVPLVSSVVLSLGLGMALGVGLEWSNNAFTHTRESEGQRAREKNAAAYGITRADEITISVRCHSGVFHPFSRMAPSSGGWRWFWVLFLDPLFKIC